MNKRKESDSFEAVARRYGADESGKKFERAFKKIARAKPRKSGDGGAKRKASQSKEGR